MKLESQWLTYTSITLSEKKKLGKIFVGEKFITSENSSLVPD